MGKAAAALLLVALSLVVASATARGEPVGRSSTVARSVVPSVRLNNGVAALVNVHVRVSHETLVVGDDGGSAVPDGRRAPVVAHHRARGVEGFAGGADVAARGTLVAVNGKLAVFMFIVHFIARGL